MNNLITFLLVAVLSIYTLPKTETQYDCRNDGGLLGVNIQQYEAACRRGEAEQRFPPPPIQP
jgi:hypothetical protein